MIEYHERPPGNPVPKPVIEEDRTPVEPSQIPSQTFAMLRAMRQEQRTFLAQTNNENSHERLSSVEKAVKWASPWRQILGIVIVFVVGGIGAYTFLRDKAKEAVIDTVKEAHEGDNPIIEPSVKTVEEIRTNVNNVNKGVNKLLQHKAIEQQIKEVEVELELHRQQHQEAVQEWSTKRAAGKFAGNKPKKTDGHVALEAKLKKLSKEEPPEEE